MTTFERFNFEDPFYSKFAKEIINPHNIHSLNNGGSVDLVSDLILNLNNNEDSKIIATLFLIEKYNLKVDCVFFSACITGNVEVCKYINHFYHVRIDFPFCLNASIKYAKVQSVEYLLYLGADPFSVNEFNYVLAAILYRHTEINEIKKMINDKKELVKKELVSILGDVGNIICEYL